MMGGHASEKEELRRWKRCWVRRCQSGDGRR